MYFNKENFECFVIHYTPLVKRKSYLEVKLKTLEPTWVTEKDVDIHKILWKIEGHVFGVSKRLIASDLGVNSRSLSRSRRKATVESLVFRYASLLGKQFHHITYGSLPSITRLPDKILEVSAMHVKAVRKFLISKKEWGLFLEDDSIFDSQSLLIVNEIANRRERKPCWINLNDGAGLGKTKSDPKSDDLGFFRVKPPSTRCASAYIINRSYALRFEELVKTYGLPGWLPIDCIYHVANRRMSALSYWSEKSIFIQGSESGAYCSNLEQVRRKD